jgi:hypothetical protein
MERNERELTATNQQIRNLEERKIYLQSELAQISPLSYSTDVDDEQKISDTNGNFYGELDESDQFSGSIALLDDLDGDELNDLAVGASLDDDGGSDKGAVWVLFMDEVDTDYEEQEGGIFNMSKEDLSYFL